MKILNNIEGLNLHSHLRTLYNCELELVCANSNFFPDISKMLEKYKDLAEKYPKQFVLKESEWHEENQPYYEASLYCDIKEVQRFKQILESENVKVDIVHEGDWSG